MKKILVFICFLVILMASIFAMAYAKNSHASFKLQQNTAPIVRITHPTNQAVISATSPINYTIEVADKEDGNSKYDEINAKEVLLKVQYVNEIAKLNRLMKAPVSNDAPGLAAIRTSNCFNCHNFDSKLIGPSFNAIGKKYASSIANSALLQKHILEGSTGVWGNVSMPSHPELNKEQVANIVQWIMQVAADASADYYIGNTGSFKIPANKKGAFLLTASYVDHGVESDASQRLKGEDKIVLYSK